MSVKQIPNLPAVASLNGLEEIEAVQAGVSVKLTSRQIARLSTGGTGVTLINTTAPITGGPISATGTIGLDLPSNAALFLNGVGTWTAPSGTGGITSLTSDVTATGPGAVAATLATVNANVGSFGLAASVAQFTVNAKGLITSAANVAIAIASTAITDATAAGRAMLTAATAAAQTALLNVFTSTEKGLAPASGGGAINFLRADGSWAPPAGAGGITQGQLNARVQSIGVW